MIPVYICDDELPIRRSLEQIVSNQILILDSAEQRTHLQQELKEQGIPTMVYYPKPMHLQGAFAELGYQQGDFPVSESLCERVVSLPMHPYLDEEDIKFVSNAVRAALEK